MPPRFLGSYPVRNRATIGGNICRASPSGDLLPPLLIYDARLVIFSQNGFRSVLLRDFFIGPGKTILEEDEILVEVILPQVSPSASSGYLKYSRREAMDLAIVGVAAMLIPRTDSKDELRLALGAVGPTPFRAINVEKTWQKRGPLDYEEVGTLASAECQPIDDIRSSANYRRKIVSVLTIRLLTMLSRVPRLFTNTRNLIMSLYHLFYPEWKNHRNGCSSPLDFIESTCEKS